jgi:plasmid stabilization system protein ParE
MKVRVLDEADAEAIEAANWYEGRCPGLGHDFRAELKLAFDQIRNNPRRFALMEYRSLEGEVRRAILDRFPYLVVFEVFENEILVLAVSHAKRDQSYWESRRE